MRPKCRTISEVPVQNERRYHSISDDLKAHFGRKMVKLSLEAGFTCPNRDGTLGTGGCAFCSAGGSGELASTIADQIALLSDKWPNAGYLAYFQSHTNTYAPVSTLRRLYEEALSHPLIEGLVIATRPDCLSDEVIALLAELNRKHFLWIELGLQSIHQKTLDSMNTGYTLADFDRAVSELHRHGIRTVAHLILGLPGESEEDIFASVRYVTDKPIYGLKLHLLNVIKGSALYERMPDYVSFRTMEEYVDLVVRLLTIIPPEITIHRLTGDVPRKLLVSPEWSYRKRSILNAIDRQLREQKQYQGASR